MMDDSVGCAADHFEIITSDGELILYFVDEELFWTEAASRETIESFNAALIERGWAWLRDESKNELEFPGCLDSYSLYQYRDEP
jgi:hypothetical protein